MVTNLNTDFLTQALYILVINLAYYAGGYIASLAKEELKQFEKITNWLLIVFLSITIGMEIIKIYSLTYGIAGALIGLIILLTLLKNRDLLVIVIILMSVAIILNCLFSVALIGIVVILQGILDYKKYLHAKKKNKKMFFYKSIGLLLIPIVIVALSFLFM